MGGGLNITVSMASSSFSFIKSLWGLFSHWHNWHSHSSVGFFHWTSPGVWREECSQEGECKACPSPCSLGVVHRVCHNGHYLSVEVENKSHYNDIIIK